MKIITVINQKGGVGKSTTTQLIGAGLKHLHKKKVLFIDLDAQGNLTYCLDGDYQKNSIFDVLTGKCNINDAIQETPQGDLICSNSFMSIIEQYIKDFTVLKDAIAELKNKYDYIIIDTPPSLGLASINALTTSNEVIIPSQADIFSLQGIGELNKTIISIKNISNPTLTIKGILLTRYNKRSILSQNITKILDDTAKALNTKIFKTSIREGVAIKEAQALKKNLFEYAPNSNPASDYKNLIKELIK